MKVHPLYLKGIFGQNLSQIVTYILQKAFFKLITESVKISWQTKRLHTKLKQVILPLLKGE